MEGPVVRCDAETPVLVSILVVSLCKASVNPPPTVLRTSYNHAGSLFCRDHTSLSMSTSMSASTSTPSPNHDGDFQRRLLRLKLKMVDLAESSAGSADAGSGSGSGNGSGRPYSSGTITPPASEDGRCHSADLSTLADHVNNQFSTPPSTPPRLQADRRSLQREREANRSKQFTTRLQRAASDVDKETPGRQASRGKRNLEKLQRNSLGSDPGEEKVNGQEVLTNKMAFAEQQKWITVQQKTFTKWWVDIERACTVEASMTDNGIG
jgi:hypothetical protein